MTADKSVSTGKVIVLTLFIVSVLVVVTSYLFILLMGYGFVFFTPEGLALTMQPFNSYLLLFFLFGFYTTLEAGAVFSLISVVYIACFIAAWKWRESFHNVIGKSFSRSYCSLFNNFLFIMPLISSMLLTAVIAIIYTQDLAGVPTGQPIWPRDTPLQEIFLQVAYAPVAEELGFRLIPLGLVIVLYVFSAGKNIVGRGFKLLITSFFYPDGAKKMAGLKNVSDHGVWRGISVAEWIMVLAISLVFGYAHIISGIGWEVGKITSVFVQGFFFAFTYLAYGFEAPILLHWFFNYYFFFFDPEVATKFFPTTIPLLSAIELVTLALGILGWLVFAVIGLRMLLKRLTTRHETPTATFP